MDEMHCNELVTLVTDYIEGTLSLADRARLEAHLPDCPYCGEYVEQMRVTVARLGDAPAGERLSPDARARLLDAFRRRP